MKAVRRRGSIGWKRALAIGALLFALAPMAASVTGCFTLASLVVASVTSPDPRVIPAGDALHLEPGQQLALKLRDGSKVQGRYRGRTLLAPEVYASRFESRARSGRWSPFALGETLRVERADGQGLEAPFGGHAMRALLLRADAEGDYLRVPLDEMRTVQRRAGDLVSLDSLLAADVRGELPSAEALAVEEEPVGPGISQRSDARRVPHEDVATVTVRASGRSATGIIVLGVVLDVVVIALVAVAAQSSGGGCTVGEISLASADVRWTDRPFDRERARFLDAELAGPEPLPTLPDKRAVGAPPVVEPAPHAAAR